MDVFKRIKEKPGAFFKKFIPIYNNPLTYSVRFKDWYVREEGWRVEELINHCEHYPAIVSRIAQYVEILETRYPDEKWDYGNETYLSLAITLYDTYQDRLEKYISKKGDKSIGVNDEQIWRELAYRGFIPLEFVMADLPKNKYYIVTAIGNMAYAKFFDTKPDAILFGAKFGIAGTWEVSQHPKK